MDRGSRPGVARPRAIQLAWLVVPLAGLVWALGRLTGARDVAGGAKATALIWTQVCVAVLAGYVIFRAWKSGAAAVAKSWATARAFAYAWLLAILGCSVLVGVGLFPADAELEKLVTISLGVIGTNLVFVAHAWLGGRAARLRRGGDVVLGNVLLTLIAVELLTVVWGRLFPSQYVWDDTSARSRLEACRRPAGESHFGFRLNSGGYLDEEFFVAGERDFVVGLIADSFGLGVVPYAYNFATVAESALAEALGDRYERVAVHNHGVPAIGMAEYAYLLDHEVMAYRPALVAVCAFVGNDVLYGWLRRHPRRLYTLQRWLFWQIGERVIGAGLAARAHQNLVGIAREKPEPRPGHEIVVPAWIKAPELEKPGLTEAAFRDLESVRAEVTNTRSSRTADLMARFLEGVDRMHDRLGDRLLLVLIPDEFQVDDELWSQVLATKPGAEPFDRDSPQRTIVAHCRERQVAVLDLLPDLRAHLRAGGERPYHLRDTHWNATGNRIAGERIASWIVDWHSRRK